uniref:Peptidyl-prolyl cis-trans isomerase n=1 Tax=Globodera rostochiensis TaxID=31243 RepID=A0A914I9L1_GLORO
MAVLIETTLGDLVIDLFVEERPNMCKNFLKLCKTKYYNLCQFFTIEPNYIAQTGDPTNAGRGGESIFGTLFGEQARFIEMEKVPKLRHSQRGIVSMVNNGDGMVGSQFFVTLGDELDYLDGKHCIFGQVGEGMDTVKKLNDELVDKQNRPYRDIRIAHTIVLVDPFDDPPRMRIPKRSPSPTIDLIKLDNQIALDERLDEDEGKTEEELRKELEVKDMKAQAQILEIVGDLHYAEERPPDNVLFVCKLNPVTTGEDLQVIFSRFGEIVSCEVICDRRTGASLQYAFIEFEQPEQCEAAYLKMDNVLIDDRRIHVDFSQSVSKNFQWKRGEQSKGTIKNASSSSASAKQPSSPPRERSSQQRRHHRHGHEKEHRHQHHHHHDHRKADRSRDAVGEGRRRRSRSGERHGARRSEAERRRNRR